MHIAQAEHKDLREILNLQYMAYQSEAKLCHNPIIPPLVQTLEEVEAEFTRGTFLKGMDENGALIASVRAYSDNDTLYIGKLMVRPDLQGRGLGTKLMKAIEHMCPHERYELFTSTKSERNITLYERLGYIIFQEKDMGNDLKFVYLCKMGHLK